MSCKTYSSYLFAPINLTWMRDCWRNFIIRMYFILNLSCFVLSFDSSACLGNNVLLHMYSQIFINLKTNNQNVKNML